MPARGEVTDPIQKLLVTAVTEPLKPSQATQLIAALQNNPGLVAAVGLNPDELPTLVKNNALVGGEVRPPSVHPFASLQT